MSALEIIQTEVKTMSHKQNWFWSLPLMGFLVVFFTQCESTTEEVKRTEESSLSPIECFDYKYPITVVIEDDTSR